MHRLLLPVWRRKDLRHIFLVLPSQLSDELIIRFRQSILVDHFNVKIMGREMWGEMGVSHNVVEGIGSLRVLPNLIVLSPADVVEAEKAFIAMADYIGPVYFRIESQSPYENIY